ncbi:hypothetical protein M23134_05806 [Microscilla marina ATCC 23134]|uniref:Uncharacterized protein n=1 Tax=Microscilla marina ATCC 23134 TaxID=313606 RepID=A1ZIR5_MICM2|nr:hypothetical protein M23134_05806 [Microscilla marina ATCC 23134]
MEPAQSFCFQNIRFSYSFSVLIKQSKRGLAQSFCVAYIFF